jgi:pyruvate dehydrogenase E2 component (dihydrolipoamide acetyltransferase)
MAELVVMPKLGFDMKEGTFAAWVKKVGDHITSGDVIAEVETDKATVEVETYATGTLLHVMASAGDILEVGVPIAVIGAPGEDFSALVGGSARPAPVEAASAPAPSAAPIAPAPAAPVAPTSSNGGGNGHVAQLAGGIIKASPVARRIASERGINLNMVVGSGPGGRIIRQDVEAFTPPAISVTSTPAASAGTLSSAPTYKVMENIPHDVVDTTKLRKTIARRMVEAKQWVPHFLVTMSMDTTALLDLRKQINAKLDKENQITVNDLIVKATALTLRQYPNLNSHYHGETIVRYHDINIGIAVALPQGGLINVVARHADRASLTALAKKNKEMIAGAREGKVKPEDIEGSTFTVSNLGAFGVDHFTAIINPPEAGILAIGASLKVPVVNLAGELVIGNVMKVTISVDHRVSDGAEGADFMRYFKELIEDPMRLLV